MSAVFAPLHVTAGQFLEALYPAGIDGHISLLIRTPDEGVHVEWASTIDEIRDHARTHNDRADIWFGPSPRRRRLGTRRGGIDDCTTLPALWVDIDIAGDGHASTGLPADLDAAIDLLTSMPLAPSVLIHSGGGLQAWWLLSEPIERDDAVALLTAWGGTWATLAERAGVDIDNVFSLDRVLRLPNTHNHKLDHARPVSILGWEPGRRYGVDDVEQHLLDPPAPPPALEPTRIPYIGPRRPGDHFNATVAAQAVLQRAGWTFAARTRSGDEHWTRPGKDTRAGWSATVYAADGHTTVWSDSPSLPAAVETRRPYDPFGLHVALNHNGDHRAAARELAALGFGERTVAEDDILEWVAAHGGQATGGVLATAEHFPEVVWDAHPILDHIRTAARARRVSPDAVLAAVLTRVAAATPHIVDIPPIVGVSMGMSYFAAIVGAPETGKSAAAAVAADLLPVDRQKVHDRVPVGSGEGFVEILFGMRPDPENAKRQIKVQTHNAAIFHIDEGAVLVDIGARSGSTLLPTLRTAYTHGTLGNANASIERRRILEGHLYVYGVTLGIQPELAGPLLDDASGGTPQRFLWAMATDPGAPPERPEWPGALGWEPPTPKELQDHEGPTRGGCRRSVLHYCQAAWDHIDDDRQGVLTGSKVKSNIDAHANLVRLKTAGLLALLTGTMTVTDEHWALAGRITDASVAVRNSIEATLQIGRRSTEASMAEKRARVELRVHEVTEQRKLERAAAIVGRVVHRHADASTHAEQGGGCVTKCLHQALGRRYRDLFSIDEVAALAASHEWVQASGERWLPGTSRPAS